MTFKVKPFGPGRSPGPLVLSAGQVRTGLPERFCRVCNSGPAIWKVIQANAND